jgi:peptide deformylase
MDHRTAEDIILPDPEAGTKFSEVAVAGVRHDIKLSPIAEVENVVCEDVTEADLTEEHIDLTKRMLRYLSDIEALGLSACQIGIKKKFFVFWSEMNEPKVRYNTQYFRDASWMGWREKCLTYGDKPFLIKRHKAIRAIWYENEGGRLVKVTKRLTGRDSQVFQHETDHQNGKTIAMLGLPTT